MAAPNILNATSIIGKSATVVATASTQDLLTCPANKLIKITSMFATNTHSGAENIDIRLKKNGVHCEKPLFGMDAAHPTTAGETFPGARTQQYPAGWYMEENDVLQVVCGAGSVMSHLGAVTVCVSYDLIDDA